MSRLASAPRPVSAAASSSSGVASSFAASSFVVGLGIADFRAARCCWLIVLELSAAFAAASSSSVSASLSVAFVVVSFLFGAGVVGAGGLGGSVRLFVGLLRLGRPAVGLTLLAFSSA